MEDTAPRAIFFGLPATFYKNVFRMRADRRKYCVQTMAQASEKRMIPGKIASSPSNAPLCGRGHPSRIPSNNAPYAMRKVIRIDPVHNAATFHPGAEGYFLTRSHSGAASARKIAAISMAGYSKNHPDRPIE